MINSNDKRLFDSTPLGVYSAAASAAGYLFQCRYALLAALEHVNRNTGLEISIEKFDDIAFERDGKPLELIQTKHRVTRTGNLSNASTDLWKTLRIWSETVLNDPSVLGRLRFLLVTTASAPEGSAASYLRPGINRKEDEALSQLLKVSSTASGTTNIPCYTAFSNLSYAAKQELLRSIIVVDAVVDLNQTQAQIQASLRMAAPQERLHTFVQYLEGWWWGRICEALLEPEKSTISIAEVECKIDELRESFRRDALPVSMGASEPSAEVAVSYEEFNFVKQLRLVGLQGNRLEFAKRDFYRAYEQRSQWAREKLLFDGEIATFQRTLTEEWEVRYEAMKDNLADSQDEPRLCDEGRQLAQWVERDARFPLRSVNERFLTVGSYHMLSNRLLIGWHRDFKSRFSSADTQGNTVGDGKQC
jgi:hypothetical protein